MSETATPLFLVSEYKPAGSRLKQCDVCALRRGTRCLRLYYIDSVLHRGGPLLRGTKQDKCLFFEPKPPTPE